MIYQRAKIIFHKDYPRETVGRLLWVIAERPVRFTGVMQSKTTGNAVVVDEESYWTHLIDEKGNRLQMPKSRVELLPERGENVLLETFSRWLVRKDP